MKMLNALRRWRFPLLLAVFFVGLDWMASALLGPWLVSSGRFILNDYEIVRRAHPEAVWDQVFFGNSIVISAYLEEESESGYVNLGVDYGVVTDLWDMLRKKEIQVGSELVIGLNDLTLYDEFPTNPAYPWHREPLEPFLYFYRDRLRLLVEETAAQAFTGFVPEYGKYAGQERAYYYGSLSQTKLDEKAASSPYLALPMEDFEENFAALEEIAAWCGRNGVRLRLLWMPLNPDFQVPKSTLAVKARTEALCAQLGLEFKDWSGALDRACFYDFGHLNHEYGAHVFTKEIDQWLLS
ncbi:MAG: hypothetical protein HFF08_01120 [Oscillospiraceae bacterium]|nr:hypothetical protein [Oscillospiraceae bacterium]